MNAPTAATILRALERQRFQSDMSALAELDAVHSEAVRAALSAIPRKSKIDVRLLVSTVKREVAERETNKPKPDPFKFECTLLSNTELLSRIGTVIDTDKRELLRAELAWRERTYGTVIADAEPDDEDEPPEPPRRRSLPRVKSKRPEPVTRALESSALTRRRDRPKAKDGPFVLRSERFAF